VVDRVEPEKTAPPLRLVLLCVEVGDKGCRQSIEVPFEHLAVDKLTRYLFDHGEWLVSVVSPPGAGHVVMASLCLPCARRVQHPGVLKLTLERLREKKEKKG